MCSNRSPSHMKYETLTTTPVLYNTSGFGLSCFGMQYRSFSVMLLCGELQPAHQHCTTLQGVRLSCFDIRRRTFLQSVQLNGTAKKTCDQPAGAIDLLCSVQNFETNCLITIDFLAHGPQCKFHHHNVLVNGCVIRRPLTHAVWGVQANFPAMTARWQC